MRVGAVVLALIWAGAAVAQQLELPGAEMTAEQIEDVTLTLPSGAWADGSDPAKTDGRVLRRAWRFPADARRPSELADAARAQLIAQQYEVMFSCTASTCGGYDFRFAVPTLPAPAMFVDLGDFAYTLFRGPEGSLAAILSSRAGPDGYLQLIAGGASGGGDASPDRVAPISDLWAVLERQGHVSLDDLTFRTGSSTLADQAFPSLQALSEGLAREPGSMLALVGHSDTVGGFDANLDLSRQRAEAVRDVLVRSYGADPARVTARGASYLSPRASNDTEAGRRANRRVEAVLIR